VRGTATFLVAPGSIGLAPGKTATAASVQVTLAGPVPILKRVDPSQIKVSLDLTNLAAGSHVLVPAVVVPDGLTLVSIAPERLVVEIR
jgi:YbbR domain-containing protein